MDKNSAVKLLNETFNKDFDVNRYLTLIKELFNNFNVREYSSIIWKEYQHYIENYKSFGTYTDSKKKVVDVLVVKLKKTSSRDRARTMQRNFIAKYLGNAEKDAALVAFYGDDEDWRFSFVKMEYNLVKDETGKVKVAKELTPAKRYSFLVGVNEPNHTAQQQLYPLLKEEDVNPNLEQIEHAFSIERVTKEFFDKYKGLFLRLKESLEKVVEKDSLIKKEFDTKNISVVDFSKKLLGQIVFIYFLQKKGWLGVERGEKWGTGPKNFMRALLGDKENKPLIKYKNFFNEILEPLFYDALANSREGDDGYHTHFKCKIPFLNGGLFEPMNDYDWVKTDIILDNNIFEDIFDTFDEFNFTVKEDEPLEKEVAVDPEMLGKVFENLLDVIDRKSKGAFYTPREIVHYMCQQSLINYLETNSDVLREDIEKFIQLGDFSTSNDERVLEDIKSKQDKLKKGIINASTFDIEVKQLIEKLSLPKSIIENKEKIDDLLKEIKVVDPAVGSGAFPVGMLNEIVKARATLSIFLVKQRNDYDLKREIIENCLYGVDIDSSAVDITKLRFWLSLIVDELDMKNIKPLPNLDHKIICGDSLLEEFEGKKLFDEKLLGEVKRDFAKELKEISEKERELYNDQNKDNFESELKKLERKRKKIQNEAMKDRTSSQATLSDSISLRIKESQVKLRELKRLQKEFFNEENKKLKKEHRERIDELEWELVEETLKEEGNEEAIERLQEYKKNKSKPFFLWKLYFAEVFQRENPGFDVVIANPPYLEARSSEFTTEMKNNLQNFIKNRYPTEYKYIPKGSDLLIYFFVRALLSVRKKGFVSFISQNSWLDTDYGKKFQQFLLNHTKVKAIVDSDYKQFETANINTVITFFVGNEKSEEEEEVLFLRYHKSFDKILYSFSKIDKKEHLEEDMTLKSFKINKLNKLNFKWGLLLYSDPSLLEIFDSMSQFGKKIEDIRNISVSCGQGLNLTKDHLIDPKFASHFNKKALIPIMTKKEGAPFELNKTFHHLVDKALITKEQLQILKNNELNAFDKSKTSKLPPKLILPRGVSRHYCTFNAINSYSSSAVDIYIVNKDEKTNNLVAKRLWIFLNSSLAWLIREISGRKNLGGGMLKAEATDLKQFELYFDLNEQKCEKIFNKLRGKEAEKTLKEINNECHYEIDDFVFELLKLSETQKKYVREKLKAVLENRENKAST